MSHPKQCTKEHDCPVLSIYGHRDGCYWGPGGEGFELGDGWNMKPDYSDAVIELDSWDDISKFDAEWEDNLDGIPSVSVETSTSKAVDKWSGSYGGTHSFVRTCDHNQDKYQLPDGTYVYLSSSTDVSWNRIGRVPPDWGCYLCSSWDLDCPAIVIDWPDYGLPKLSRIQVRTLASDLLCKAQAGLTVELGCMGGHGRTGTLLGVLELLTMEHPDATAAIDAVHKYHCSKAIETKKQEWYLAAHAADLLGVDPPPEPVTPVFKAGKFNNQKPWLYMKCKDGLHTECTGDGTGTCSCHCHKHAVTAKAPIKRSKRNRRRRRNK